MNIIITITTFFIFSQFFIFGQIENIESVCGNDDRISFNHPAVGRIVLQPNGTPSTGWILYDGRIVTAAHVFNLKTSGDIYFNVPASNSCSSWGYPSNAHKYKIKWNTIIKSQPHSNGDDWAIFEVEPNSITGLTPIEAQESFFWVEQKTLTSDIHFGMFGDLMKILFMLQAMKEIMKRFFISTTEVIGKKYLQEKVLAQEEVQYGVLMKKCSISLITDIIFFKIKFPP
jgi:hypothetical protein